MQFDVRSENTTVERDRATRLSGTGPSALRLMLAAVLGIAIAVALAVALTAAGDPEPPLVPAWRRISGLVLQVGGVVAMTVFAVLRWRSGRLRAGFRQGIFGFGFEEQRMLIRQIRGRRPVDPSRIGDLRLLADNIVRQQGWIFTYPVMGAVSLGLALQTSRILPWVLAGMVLASTGPGIWQSRREARRAQAFLAAHPEPTAGDRS